MKKISGFNDPNDFRVQEDEKPKVNRKIERSEEKHKDSHKNKKDDFEQLLEKKDKKSAEKKPVVQNFAPSIFDLASSGKDSLKSKKGLFNQALSKVTKDAKDEEQPEEDQEIKEVKEKETPKDFPKIKGLGKALMHESEKSLKKQAASDKPADDLPDDKTVARQDNKPTKTPDQKVEDPFAKKSEPVKKEEAEAKDTLALGKSIPAKATSEVRPAEKAEAPRPAPKAVVELVQKMVAKLTTTTTPTDFKTTFVVKTEGVFNGTEVTLKHAQNAENEFNVEFRNLSNEARLLIQDPSNQEHLKQSLENKGYVLHLIAAPYEAREKPAADSPIPHEAQEGYLAQGDKEEKESSDSNEEEDKEA